MHSKILVKNHYLFGLISLMSKKTLSLLLPLFSNISQMTNLKTASVLLQPLFNRTRGSGQKQMHRSSTWIGGRTSLLCRWTSTGTGCPERVWSLPHWKYSGSIWTQLSTKCSGMVLLEQGCWARGPTEVPSSLTHSVTLGFLPPGPQTSFPDMIPKARNNNKDSFPHEYLSC